jgi:hypothetical protein
MWETSMRDTIIAEALELASNFTNAVFFVSGGPIAKVLIHRMWSAYPVNQYIDFGSALDETFKGKKTRPYAKAGDVFSHAIDWSWIVLKPYRNHKLVRALRVEWLVDPLGGMNSSRVTQQKLRLPPEA